MERFRVVDRHVSRMKDDTTDLTENYSFVLNSENISMLKYKTSCIEDDVVDVRGVYTELFKMKYRDWNNI